MPAHVPTLLRQLLTNLVLNGIRHNVDGPDGSVSVRTDTGEDGTVTNTGPVVAPETLSTLTEPFVRGDGRLAAPGVPRGSGLGLAIVSRVAEAHGAQLHLDARPAGGLDARVRFRTA